MYFNNFIVVPSFFVDYIIYILWFRDGGSEFLLCTVLCKYFFQAKSVFISWNVTWVCIFPLYVMLPVFFHMTLPANSEEMKSSLTEDYFDMSV